MTTTPPTTARRNLTETFNASGETRLSARTRRGPRARRSPLLEIAGGTSGVPTLPPNTDRAAVLWRAKVPIVLVTVIVAVAVYGASHFLTPTYSSSTTVRISASPAAGGSASDAPTASNTLAAQDAQIVKSEAVPAAAAAHHLDAATLDNAISAGTIASQNLIQITAQSSKAADAKAWADDVATALSGVIHANSASQVKLVKANEDAALAPLEQQIATLQAQIKAEGTPAPGSATYAAYTANQATLTELTNSRGTADTQYALQISSATPIVQVLPAVTAPAQVAPKPSLYGAIAAAGALLIACQIALSVARRRLRDE